MFFPLNKQLKNATQKGVAGPASGLSSLHRIAGSHPGWDTNIYIS